MLAGDPNALQPTQFALTLFAIHAYSELFDFKHALLQESRYHCPRCIFRICIACSVCPNSVRKSTS